MTTTTDNNNNNNGAWIGIDLGTTNCAAAVYDRTRGGCKWMRIPTIGIHEEEDYDEVCDESMMIKHPHSTKMGRIIPSIVILATEEYINANMATTKEQQQQQQQRKNQSYKWYDVSHLLRSTTIAKDSTLLLVKKEKTE